MALGPMSHIKFKKCPCRSVDFRGLGPLSLHSVGSTGFSLYRRGPDKLIQEYRGAVAFPLDS